MVHRPPRDRQGGRLDNVWTGKVVATGRTTPYKHALRTTAIDGGGMAFAGTRDDPFFFDLPGFVGVQGGAARRDDRTSTAARRLHRRRHLRRAPTSCRSRSSVPNAKLGGTGETIGVWATTSVRSNGGWAQVDRKGRPAINTVFNGLLLPSDSHYNGLEKDAFNGQRPAQGPRHHDRQRRGRPRRDRQRARRQRRHALHGRRDRRDRVRPAAGRADADPRLERRVRLRDVARDAGLNGRQLDDDVIDAEFALLTNFVITTGDGVDGNDKSFLGPFPYLAGPH